MINVLAIQSVFEKEFLFFFLFQVDAHNFQISDFYFFNTSLYTKNYFLKAALKFTQTLYI